MSIEIEEVSTANSYYVTAVEAVTGLAEFAMQQNDPTERLRLFVGVGQMATGVLAFVETSGIPAVGLRSVAIPLEQDLLGAGSPEPTVELPTKLPESLAHLLENVVEAPESATPPETDNEERLQDELTTIVEELAPVVKPERKTKELTAEQQAIAERYPELKLTAREATLMQAIIATNGEKFGNADVTTALGDVAPPIRYSTMSFLLQKLRASPYAEQLIQKGQKRASRYWWKDGEYTAPESEPETELSEPEVFHPTPHLMPRHQPAHEAHPVAFSEHEVVVIQREKPKEIDLTEKLAEFDLALSGEAHAYLSRKGVPVKLSEAEVNVLLEVLRHGGEIQYADLLKGPTIQDLKNRGGNPARLLNAILLNIEAAATEHNLPWATEKTLIDHKKVIVLHFGTQAAKVAGENPDFLV